MNDLPRWKLIELIRAEGTAPLNDPPRLYAYLQSSCPGLPGEVAAIMGAARQGAPGGLISAVADPSVPWTTVTSTWAQRLQEQERMPPDVAAWAVDSWAMALGVGPAPIPPQGQPPLAAPGHSEFSQPIPAQPQFASPPFAAPPQQQYPQPLIAQPIAQTGPAPQVSQPPARKSSKVGPLILVIVLAVIAAGCWYFFTRMRFDSALTGAWHNTMADGPATWDRTWNVSSFGSFKLSETLTDAGQVEVRDPEKILVFHSDHLGNMNLNFRFASQEKLFFTGPVLGPGAATEWDWSTVDRGIPDAGKITFVGTWLMSAPVDGLSGGMKLVIDYNSRYTLQASYSGGGSMTAKQGEYELRNSAGGLTDSGTYTVDNPSQIEFTSSDTRRGRMTWNRGQ